MPSYPFIYLNIKENVNYPRKIKTKRKRNLNTEVGARRLSLLKRNIEGQIFSRFISFCYKHFYHQDERLT